MLNYAKAIQEVKEKSFPSLKNHKIIIKETDLFWGARAIYLYFFSLYLIGRGRHLNNKISKGSIAHELSHLEMFKKWGFWKSVSLAFLQYFSTKTRRKIERGADLLTIKKGYGKSLYDSRKRFIPKASERIQRLVNKYYLSLEEIKKYTEKKKKSNL